MFGWFFISGNLPIVFLEYFQYTLLSCTLSFYQPFYHCSTTGILPKFLGHRNAYGAPTFGVLLSASGVICLGWLSFAEVIDMLNLLFCYGQAIEFFAFLWLRWAHPNMHRPYTVPIGLPGMCVILAFPLAFIFVIIAISSQMALVVSGTLTGINEHVTMIPCPR